MEPDFRDLVERLVKQIDFDNDIEDNISEELWDLHVEAKLALKNTDK